MKIEIAPIEDRLADLGIETRYTGDDEYTSYVLSFGSRELEILDGVSGDYYRPADITEAIVYRVGEQTNVTDDFEAVTTADEFVRITERLLAA